MKHIVKLFLASAISLFGNAITGGTLKVSDLDRPVFDFEGNGFGASGSTAISGFQFNCRPCSPGHSLSINLAPSGSDFDIGAVRKDGIARNVSWFSNSTPESRFELIGPFVVIDGPGKFESVFTMTGYLCASGRTGMCDPVLDDLNGRGSVQLEVVMVSGLLYTQSAVFTFDNPAPEPNGMAYIGIGLVSIILLLRCRS